MNPSGFSWLQVSLPLPALRPACDHALDYADGFANQPPARAQRHSHRTREDSQSVPTSVKTGCWNMNQLCIGYASRPHLSSRLTLGRFALPRKPWVYDGGGSHPSLCYLCQHSPFATLHHVSRHDFIADANAPLPLSGLKAGKPSTSARHLSPGTFSAQESLTSELLRFL